MFELSGTLRFHSFARRLITRLLICGTVILGDPRRLKSVRCFDCVVCFVTLQLLLWTNEFFFGFEDCRCLWKSVFITEKWFFFRSYFWNSNLTLMTFPPNIRFIWAFVFLYTHAIIYFLKPNVNCIWQTIVLIIFNNVFWLMLYSFLSLSFSPLCFW